jgi:putative oxidoreductase
MRGDGTLMRNALDEWTAPYAALLLRVGLGGLFIAHLYWKFFVLNGGFDAWWGQFEARGYAWYVPWYAVSAEIAGALCLIPGIWPRWAALYAVPLIFGAAQFWLTHKGFYFTAAGCELPVVWGVALIVLALLGDGPWVLLPSPMPKFLKRGVRT